MVGLRTCVMNPLTTESRIDQLLDRIRPGEGEDVQVWQGAEEGSPGHGPPPDGTAQDDLTDGSAESGLGEGVHGEGRRIAAANA